MSTQFHHQIKKELFKISQKHSIWALNKLFKLIFYCTSFLDLKLHHVSLLSLELSLWFYFFLGHRPTASGEFWTVAVWGEQLWRHLAPHCISTNGDTHSALWLRIHHHYNSPDLPGRGGGNFSETSINFVTQHNSSSLIRICTVSAWHPFPHFYLQVSYVSVSTRETYSKVGRELLAAIAAAHPYVISVLLERLRDTIQTVGMVGIVIPY